MIEVPAKPHLKFEWDDEAKTLTVSQHGNIPIETLAHHVGLVYFSLMQANLGQVAAQQMTDQTKKVQTYPKGAIPKPITPFSS